MAQIQSWLQHLLNDPWKFFYNLIQTILDVLLSPTAPKPGAPLTGKKIAVIGAGITGVSSASHCVGHGFDVVIFEAGDEEALGGIWAKVNNTSGLQIHSLMYRFHPSVRWSKGYPNREEIVGAVRDLWTRYGLKDKTKFNTRVEKVYKDRQGRWIINNESYGRFDGIIASVGTCGDPKKPKIEGQDKFKGSIFHSSQLDGKAEEAKGKDVLIIGGGASAVEALEFVQNAQAKHTYVLSRSEKWIIPRNPVIDILLALNIFGQETLLSWIPEGLLRLFFYRDLKDIAPPKGSKGLFTETPMVNNDVFELIREGKAEWLRGDILNFEQDGIKFNKRASGVPKDGVGRRQLIKGDLCILATGYTRPSLDFLPEQCFEENYSPPDWYLQTFPPQELTVCAINSCYANAIGSVGNYHIGIYTRFLLMFLTDPLAQPTPWLMHLWIDFTRFVKRTAPTKAFDFFTYSELIYWFCFVIVINPFRWKWAPFVLFGIGSALPKAIVEQEDALRARFGNGKTH